MKKIHLVYTDSDFERVDVELLDESAVSFDLESVYFTTADGEGHSVFIIDLDEIYWTEE